MIKLKDVFYQIMISLIGSGTVTSNPAGILCREDCIEIYLSGTDLALTATPNPGWTFTGWGRACSGAEVCAVAMTGDQEVTATFAVQTYAVTAIASPNGKISPAVRTVNHGATTIFTVTPNPGYVSQVSGCDGTLSINTYTTGPITGDCTVNTAFVRGDYTVTAKASLHGRIDPAEQAVLSGERAIFTVLPDPGYTVAVSGCNGTLSGTTYATSPINADCTINALFSVSDPVTALSAHYYTSILGRSPDAAGLIYWRDLIAQNQALGLDVKPVFRDMAYFFFNSPEHLGFSTSDTQFITDLYRTFFQREPDQGGMDFWRGQLAAGTLRHQVMGGFLYSPEFTTFMEALGF